MTVKEKYLNARKESNLKHPVTGAYLELDAWIPHLNLCFEFQVNFIYFIFLLYFVIYYFVFIIYFIILYFIYLGCLSLCNNLVLS